MDGARGDGRGDAASDETHDRLLAAARPGGDAASVDDRDDSDFDRDSVVSGASEWSDASSVRSGYTGLSGVSNADHRYADAEAVVRREAREAAAKAGCSDQERRGATSERDDDGAPFSSDASSDPSTSDGEFATRRRAFPIPRRDAKNRSLAMRLGDAALRSRAMASGAGRGGGRDEADEETFSFSFSFVGGDGDDASRLRRERNRNDPPSTRHERHRRGDDDSRVTLVEACASGDLGFARRVIERTRRETTVSRSAARSGTRGDREVLAKEEEDDDVDDENHVDALDDGRAPLHAAVELGDARGFDIVKHLVDVEGADVDVEGAAGIRPLHVAAYCGSTRCLRYLLSRGARTNVLDDDGSAPLHWAASSGKSLCASAILRADDVDADIVNRNGARAADLVDANDVATREAFRIADAASQPHALAADGRLAVLRRALTEKFGVAALAEDSPRAKRWRRRFRVTLRAESSPPEPDASGRRRRPKQKRETTILRDDAGRTRGASSSIATRHSTRPPLAIDAPDPNDASGETMVVRAARNGHAATVRALVCEFGADLDARCARVGATATHAAAENGHVDVLRVVRDASGFPRTRKRRAEARTVRPAFFDRRLPNDDDDETETKGGFSVTSRSLTETNASDFSRVIAIPSGSTPLHLAARNGRAEACAFLARDMRCDVNARDGDGRTALHVAASSSSRGSLETMRLLRAMRADLDARDGDGRTPLHVAARAGAADACAFLLDQESLSTGEPIYSERKRRLLARDGRGDAPAHLASAEGHAETALALLPDATSANNDAFRGCGGWTCLHFAARGGHLELVDALTRMTGCPYADVAAADDAGATALHVAAEVGVVAVLESLLAAAAERDAHSAASGDRLIEPSTFSPLSGDKVSTSDPLVDADAHAHVRLSGARALARARTNAGVTALHAACRAGNAASARVLLALCPDSLDAKDMSGAAALHFAAARADRGGAACASLLCRAGCALTERRVTDGVEPLHVAGARAAISVAREIVREAKKRGVLAAAVNRRTDSGLTPAACAARAGAAETFRFLLESGADPFVPDARGNTCAHHACCRRAAGAAFGDPAEAAGGEDDAADDAFFSDDATRARNARDVFVSTLRHATTRARADHRSRANARANDDRDRQAQVGRLGKTPDRPPAGISSVASSVASSSSVAAGLEQSRVIGAANDDGETPAHVAARSGWACLLRFLLDHGADLAATDARGRDVLQAACERDRPEAVATILAYVEAYGEDNAETRHREEKGSSKSEGVITPAAFRWRALRRSLPDVLVAARGGVVFDAESADVEDALEAAIRARLGVVELCRGESCYEKDEKETENEPDDAEASLGSLGSLTKHDEKPLDAFAHIDAALRRAEKAFGRARRARFANRRSRVTGDAPLHVAASRAHANVVRVLVRAGADVNLRDEGDGGDAPLHRAARAGRVLETTRKRKATDAAVVLLRFGADLHLENAARVTPLHQAVRVGDVALVGTLLRFAEKAESRALFAFPEPALQRSEKKTRGASYELVNRADRSGATPLHSAAELGHVEIFDALLAFGAEWDARTIRNESVAHVAARLGRDAVLSRLLARRDEEASGSGSRDDFLTSRDHTESFPIHWAAANGHASCVALLIQSGSPVGIGGMWRGATPAHLAARAGAAETLRVLLAAGADVNAQDFWQMATPLHYAAEAGAHETTRVLMESRARLDAADSAGVIPERAARDASLGMAIRAFRIIGVVGRRLSGIAVEHVFYAWRAVAHDARAARARDAKGTWQLVFALFAEREDDLFLDGKDETDDTKNVDVAKYYWLWRQWETRRRRRRRALGVGPRDAARARAVADALEANPATAGLRHAALAWLAERAASAARDETFARGEAVWREGAATDGTMCVVLDGRFGVFMTHEDSRGVARERAVASLGPGATFGETSLRFDGRRPTTVRARVADSRVTRVSRADFERAWEMEREAVEREARETRARRAAARRRRRAARLLAKRNQKKDDGNDDDDDAVASDDDSDDVDFRSTVDPGDLTPFALETSRDPPRHSAATNGLPRENVPSGKRRRERSVRRSLFPWEREFLASLVTVVAYDPGESLPTAPRCDDEHTGDPLRDATEDAYFGFVLRGSVLVSTVRGFGETRETSVDVLGPGQTYFSIAARETRGGRVLRYGADAARVATRKSADDAEPATVALLQGADVLELPRSLRDLLFRRAAVHARWCPPARHVPRSTAEPDSESEPSEDEEEEEEEEAEKKSRMMSAPARDVVSVPAAPLRRDEPAWDDRGLLGAFVEELVEAFHHVDTDRGGDIDENELKFAARALGFEPHPKRLRRMLAAMDADGGGSVDLAEFIETVARRVAGSVDPSSLDAAFDAFDADRSGTITQRDVARVAKRVGDPVASSELDALMNFGAADADGDGRIDRAEFGEIMRVREADPAARRAALRREIKRQKDASEDAAVVAEMLGEYDAYDSRSDPAGRFEESERVLANRPNGVADGARAAAAKKRRDERVGDAETPLRATLRAVFDAVARLGGAKRNQKKAPNRVNPSEDGNEDDDDREGFERRSASEIDVRDLIRALRADAEGDGSLARALHLPQRLTLRRDDGTAERFEVMFREMDADGSGSVDFEEFFAYFRRLKKERAAEIVARAVIRFDETRDDAEWDDADAEKDD